jgi:hypothetical protein
MIIGFVTNINYYKLYLPNRHFDRSGEICQAM